MSSWIRLLGVGLATALLSLVLFACGENADTTSYADSAVAAQRAVQTTSVGIIVAAHTSLCSNHIFLAGNEAQKKKYVSKLATGEFIGLLDHDDELAQDALLHVARALDFVCSDSRQLFAALCVLINRHDCELIDPAIIDPATEDCRVSFGGQFAENGFQKKYESHGVVGGGPLNYLKPDDRVEGGIDCRYIHLAK